MEIVTLATFSCCIGAVIVVIIWLKSRKSPLVEVNCWFCGKNTSVPSGNKNCWDCPYCEQYNGFTEDGDYNKPIPAQYSENLNHPVCIENRSSASFNKDSPALCDCCNRSQLLKIKQLASFVPYTEANYDMEVESYKYHLEQVYKLCRQCQQKVNQVLDIQNRRLEQQLREYEQTSPNASRKNQSALDSVDNSFCSSHLICRLSAPWHVWILRLCSVLCATTLFVICSLSLLQHSTALHMSPDQYLPHLLQLYIHGLKQGASLIVLLGLVSGLIAIYCFGKPGLHICDAASSITWLSLMAFHSHVTKKFKPEDLILLQAMLSGLNVVVCFWGFMCPRYERSTSTRLKKIGYIGLAFAMPALHVERFSMLTLCGKLDQLTSPNLQDIFIGRRRSTGSPFSKNSTPTKSKRSLTPKGQQNFSGNNIESEDLERFETMSIGSPSQKRNNRGVFSLNNQGSPFSSVNLSPEQIPNLNSLRHRKPLISPARFKPTISSPATSTRARKLFSASAKPGLSHTDADRESLFSEARCHVSHSDSDEVSSHSSVSSMCPMGSTSHAGQHHSGSEKRSLLTRVILGASIGINVALVLYFWLDFETLPGHLKYVEDIILIGCQSFFVQVGKLWTHLTNENFEELHDTSS